MLTQRALRPGGGEPGARLLQVHSVRDDKCIVTYKSEYVVSYTISFMAEVTLRDSIGLLW